MASADVIPVREMLSVDQTLRKTEILISTGIVLSSLEALCRPQDVDDGGLLSWRVSRTRSKGLTSGRSGDALDRLFSPPGIHVLVALRLAAASVAVAPGGDRRAKAAAMTFLAATNVLLQMRNSFGGEGSDHVNLVVCAALALSRFFPHDEKVRKACSAFIAGQSAVSYFAAGLAKAVSPTWRDGTAMKGIFRTRSFGQRHVNALLTRYPLLSKAGGWGVLLGEMLFPLTLVAPKPVALALLGTGVSFHAGNAAFMGLNRFVWAFGSTYPCIVQHARHLAPGRPGAVVNPERSS